MEHFYTKEYRIDKVLNIKNIINQFILDISIFNAEYLGILFRVNTLIKDNNRNIIPKETFTIGEMLALNKNSPENIENIITIIQESYKVMDNYYTSKNVYSVTINYIKINEQDYSRINSDNKDLSINYQDHLELSNLPNHVNLDLWGRRLTYLNSSNKIKIEELNSELKGYFNVLIKSDNLREVDYIINNKIIFTFTDLIIGKNEFKRYFKKLINSAV